METYCTYGTAIYFAILQRLPVVPTVGTVGTGTVRNRHLMPTSNKTEKRQSCSSADKYATYIMRTDTARPTSASTQNVTLQQYL